MAQDPKYLDSRTLERIKRLDVRARLVVEGFITGEHRSPFNGLAVEFASHREYVPGDEIKHIDWKVWSKTDRFYIKEYEEETNLQCTLLLDCSKSMRYGETEGWSKFDYAATAAASLAYLLQHQQDAVGLVAFNNRIEKNLPASSHPSRLKLMLHELEQLEPSDQTDVADVFVSLAQQIRRRGLVVLISDLLLDVEALEQAIRLFRLRRHELIVIQVLHEHELTFPFQDNTLFRGLESDAQLLAEPRALRESYLAALETHLKQVRKLCARSGVDYVLAGTHDPLDAVLAGYLSFRQRGGRAGART
ncbi:MAG: DUF58 domain-containing protein [Planctomycetales bacterium]